MKGITRVSEKYFILPTARLQLPNFFEHREKRQFKQYTQLTSSPVYGSSITNRRIEKTAPIALPFHVPEFQPNRAAERTTAKNKPVGVYPVRYLSARLVSGLWSVINGDSRRQAPHTCQPR